MYEGDFVEAERYDRAFFNPGTAGQIVFRAALRMRQERWDEAAQLLEPAPRVLNEGFLDLNVDIALLRGLLLARTPEGRAEASKSLRAVLDLGPPAHFFPWLDSEARRVLEAP